MRCDNLNGAGNVPAATLRHSVGPENGSGAARSGRLGLRTRCDSRIRALSGSVSNDGMVSAGFGACAGILAAIGFCLALLGCDIECPRVSEGSNIRTLSVLTVLAPIHSGYLFFTTVNKAWSDLNLYTFWSSSPSGASNTTK